jgi:alkanesulfonate monooxygenase SsuD/methylene tetrahydromethanopterin reductase-like flavin-dependent oxidoreductase (luciferase family)
MGGDWKRRWTQVTEHVAAMKALWTTDPSEFHGQFVNFPPVRSFPKPRSKPHPPILIASMGSPKVFQRIVDWGDGWIPIVQNPEELATGVQQLRELANAAGRDPDHFSVSVFGLQGQWRTRDEVAALEAAGADRVIVWLEDASLEEILKELETLAAELLA